MRWSVVLLLCLAAVVAAQNQPPVLRRKRRPRRAKPQKQEQKKEEEHYLSWYANANEGDWVLFLTRKIELALWTVKKSERKKMKQQDGTEVDAIVLTIEKRYFKPDGTEMTKDKEEQTAWEPIYRDDIRAKIGLGIVREENAVFTTIDGRQIECVKQDAEDAQGRRSQSLLSRAQHIGGTLFTRRGITTYVVALQWGNKNEKPTLKWNAESLRRFYSKYDRYYEEEEEEDPPKEPPEPPESDEEE